MIEPLMQNDENEKNNRWRIIIADAVIRVVSGYRRGEVKTIDFVGDVGDSDANLNDPQNVTDVNLLAVWNFADSFCDAARAGSSEVDGIEWPEATRLLEEVAEQLQSEQPITNALVLRYAR